MKNLNNNILTTRLTPLIREYSLPWYITMMQCGGCSWPWPMLAQTISMALCLISNPGNSANTDAIHQAEERSYPWTNLNKQHLIYHFRAQQQLQQQQQQQQLQLQQTNQRFVLLMFHILMMENVMLTTITKKDAMMGVIVAKKMSNA